VERRNCFFHVLMLIRSILVGLQKKEDWKVAEQVERGRRHFYVLMFVRSIPVNLRKKVDW
jgi:hypothetical protein